MTRTTKRRFLFAAVSLLALAGVVRYGNTLLILFESDAASRSFGTRDAGRLEHGKRLPSRGANFVTYSDLGSLLGRNCVHERVRSTILDSYAVLEESLPGTTFVIGETGWPRGGRFRPHKTHQNGVSVDFFVPVRDARGRPAVVPTRPWTRFGYDLDFDAEGRLGDLRIDFDALAVHLLALAESGREHGVAIDLVILDPGLQPLLFRTPNGQLLRARTRFSKRPAWVRHDEHYHVDFRLL